MPRISTPLPCGEVRPPRTDGVGPRIGSLFSGYSGLEMGVQSVLGGTVAWHSEIDPGACKILAHRYPDVPNLGDITAVDWSQVEPVDVLTGGSPCQDVSAAGKRLGMRAGTRSGLWASMCDAIDIIRPSLVVWENVRGVLSAHADSAMEPCPICVGDERDAHLRALGRVVGDLSELGYVGRWVGLRASDVGAPHGRFRVFVAAWPAADPDDARRGEHGRPFAVRTEQPAAERRGGASADTSGVRGKRRRGDGQLAGPTRTGEGDSGQWQRHGNAADDRSAVAPHAQGDGRHEGWAESAGIIRGSDAALGGDALADADCRRRQGLGIAKPAGVEGARGSEPDGRAGAWGQFEAAILRWERCVGRPAPNPTELGTKGNARLSPAFVEWMMGLPAGWVTNVPGLTRNGQLKALGNGVVPQQAAQALRLLLPDVQAVAA